MASPCTAPPRRQSITLMPDAPADAQEQPDFTNPRPYIAFPDSWGSPWAPGRVGGRLADAPRHGTVGARRHKPPAVPD
jgi:hypothetical protein